MSKIEIVGWMRDGQDYNGKEHTEVFFIIVSGQEKAVSRSDLFKIVKLSLLQRSDEDSRQDGVVESDAADGRNF